MTAPRRRTELDSLRVFVVLGLVFFHAGLVFDARDDFYVKNAETTEITTIMAGLGVVWAMPLLFLVAGVGSWHSLRKRGPGRYAAERLLRLGVPLVFATITIVPVPQWLRLRSAQPGYDESYGEFLPRFFDVRLSLADFPFVLQGEHFETGHLWFVVLLLTFSLLLVPVLRGVPARGRAVDALARAAGRPGVVLLAAVPIALVNAALGLEEGLAGWNRWAYLLLFLYGFTLATDDRFRAALRRHARVAAVLGVLAFGATSPGFMSDNADPFTGTDALSVITRVFFSFSGWCCLIAILGLLDRERPGTDRPAPEATDRAPAPEAGGPDRPTPERPAPDHPAPDQPGPDQPGPDQPGPDHPGLGRAVPVADRGLALSATDRPAHEAGDVRDLPASDRPTHEAEGGHARPASDRPVTELGPGRDLATHDQPVHETETGHASSAADRRARRFAYLGAAALPIYVLHQPIVVAVAYGVVRWDAPIIVEYAVIVAVSLVLIFAVYDLLVRRTRITRFLFGMRT